MKQLYCLLVSFLSIINANAFTIKGTVKDNTGKPLAYSSILIKGTASGTTANSKGDFTLQLEKGNYTIVCQHIGYKQQEREIIVTENMVLDFQLGEQQYSLSEVVVKSNREDPAYEIIRKTIKKREEHLNEIKKFECEVYIKGQMQLRNYPKKFMGETVDFEDGDTSKRKMLFLSETLAKYTVDKPKDEKIEIISTRVSGNSNGLGFSDPQIVSFYENNILTGGTLNPRGFISPISNNALNFYKYKFEGTFYEGGKEISRIKVIPKRKYEPLFTGYISIIEDEWRIYNVDLYLLKEQQMQYLDTFQISQIYIPLKDKWVIKQQVITPAGKILMFDFWGTFVQVYDKFNMQPDIKKNFFNNVKLKFYDSATKKPKSYWDSLRPIPLLDNEAKDYKKKDSIEQVRKDPKYLDSVDRVRNKLSITSLLLTGKTFSNQKKKKYLSIEPLLSAINFNTVEGWNVNYSPTFTKNWQGRESFYISPNFRYGFNNHHFNFHVTGAYSLKSKMVNRIEFAGGTRVFQFNNDQPITERVNSYGSLWKTVNYMKIYEASYAKLGYTKGFENGLFINANVEYQNRSPLENLPNPNVFSSVNGKQFTPNYPTEILAANISNHKATIFNLRVTFRPGTKYAELPDRTISLGSKLPTFTFNYYQAVKGLLGSDASYSKWKIGMSDKMNLKLGGRIDYRIEAGGFFNTDAVFAPDYQHIAGNLTSFASAYLNSFQLAPFYYLSNTSDFYARGHLEYHLNGLLSNKIPGFRKLNWFFVVGANTFYANPSSSYHEVFFSIENILKVIRIDFVKGFNTKGAFESTGIRINLPGVISGKRED